MILSRHNVLLRLLEDTLIKFKTLEDVLSKMVVATSLPEYCPSSSSRNLYRRSFRLLADACVYLQTIVDEATLWDPEFPGRSWLSIPGRLRFLEEAVAAVADVCEASFADASQHPDPGPARHPYAVLDLGRTADYLLSRARMVHGHLLSNIIEIRKDWPGEWSLISSCPAPH